MASRPATHVGGTLPPVVTRGSAPQLTSIRSPSRQPSTSVVGGTLLSQLKLENERQKALLKKLSVSSIQAEQSAIASLRDSEGRARALLGALADEQQRREEADLQMLELEQRATLAEAQLVSANGELLRLAQQQASDAATLGSMREQLSTTDAEFARAQSALHELRAQTESSAAELSAMLKERVDATSALEAGTLVLEQMHAVERQRSEAAAEEAAAVMLQAAWRGRAARKEVGDLKELSAAATKLQTRWRGQHARREFRVRREAIALGREQEVQAKTEQKKRDTQELTAEPSSSGEVMPPLSDEARRMLVDASKGLHKLSTADLVIMKNYTSPPDGWRRVMDALLLILQLDVEHVACRPEGKRGPPVLNPSWRQGLALQRGGEMMELLKNYDLNQMNEETEELLQVYFVGDGPTIDSDGPEGWDNKAELWQSEIKTSMGNLSCFVLWIRAILAYGQANGRMLRDKHLLEAAQNAARLVALQAQTEERAIVAEEAERKFQILSAQTSHLKWDESQTSSHAQIDMSEIQASSSHLVQEKELVAAEKGPDRYRVVAKSIVRDGEDMKSKYVTDLRVGDVLTELSHVVVEASGVVRVQFEGVERPSEQAPLEISGWCSTASAKGKAFLELLGEPVHYEVLVVAAVHEEAEGKRPLSFSRGSLLGELAVGEKLQVFGICEDGDAPHVRVNVEGKDGWVRATGPDGQVWLAKVEPELSDEDRIAWDARPVPPGSKWSGFIRLRQLSQSKENYTVLVLSEGEGGELVGEHEGCEVEDPEHESGLNPNHFKRAVTVTVLEPAGENDGDTRVILKEPTTDGGKITCTGIYNAHAATITGSVTFSKDKNQKGNTFFLRRVDSSFVALRMRAVMTIQRLIKRKKEGLKAKAAKAALLAAEGDAEAFQTQMSDSLTSMSAVTGFKFSSARKVKGLKKEPTATPDHEDDDVMYSGHWPAWVRTCIELATEQKITRELKESSEASLKQRRERLARRSVLDDGDNLPKLNPTKCMLALEKSQAELQRIEALPFQQRTEEELHTAQDMVKYDAKMLAVNKVRKAEAERVAEGLAQMEENKKRYCEEKGIEYIASLPKDLEALTVKAREFQTQVRDLSQEKEALNEQIRKLREVEPQVVVQTVQQEVVARPTTADAVVRVLVRELVEQIAADEERNDFAPLSGSKKSRGRSRARALAGWFGSPEEEQAEFEEFERLEETAEEDEEEAAILKEGMARGKAARARMEAAKQTQAAGVDDQWAMSRLRVIQKILIDNSGGEELGVMLFFAFYHFDADGNGVLDPEEWATMCAEFEIELDADEIRDLFRFITGSLDQVMTVAVLESRILTATLVNSPAAVLRIVHLQQAWRQRASNRQEAAARDIYVGVDAKDMTHPWCDRKLREIRRLFIDHAGGESDLEVLLTAAFYAFDDDHNGQLDADELFVLLDDVGLRTTLPECERLMAFILPTHVRVVDGEVQEVQADGLSCAMMLEAFTGAGLMTEDEAALTIQHRIRGRAAKREMEALRDALLGSGDDPTPLVAAVLEKICVMVIKAEETRLAAEAAAEAERLLKEEEECKRLEYERVLQERERDSLIAIKDAAQLRDENRLMLEAVELAESNLKTAEDELIVMVGHFQRISAENDTLEQTVDRLAMDCQVRNEQATQAESILGALEQDHDQLVDDHRQLLSQEEKQRAQAMQATKAVQRALGSEQRCDALLRLLKTNRELHWAGKPAPSAATVLSFAEYLGINIEEENHLLWIAQEAVMAPLPLEWESYTDEKGQLYYHHRAIKHTTFGHPLDSMYRRLFEELKELDAGVGGEASVMDQGTDTADFRETAQASVQYPTPPPSPESNAQRELRDLQIVYSEMAEQLSDEERVDMEQELEQMINEYALIAHSSSIEQASLVEMFERIDVDGNGDLDRQEISAVFDLVGMPMLANKLGAVMKAMEVAALEAVIMDSGASSAAKKEAAAAMAQAFKAMPLEAIDFAQFSAWVVAGSQMAAMFSEKLKGQFKQLATPKKKKKAAVGTPPGTPGSTKGSSKALGSLAKSANKVKLIPAVRYCLYCADAASFRLLFVRVITRCSLHCSTAAAAAAASDSALCRCVRCRRWVAAAAIRRAAARREASPR